MEFEKSLHGIRGWAFLQVIIEHYLYKVTLIPLAMFGVNFFWVLSGFLVTSNLYKRYLKTGNLYLINYFFKRIFKIYPLLIISLIFDIFILDKITISSALEIFFLISSRGYYWTIYVETRSYLLVPLYVYIFSKLKSFKKKLIFIIIFSLFFYTYHILVTFVEKYRMNLRVIPYDSNSFETNLLFFNFLPIFAFGSFAAVIKIDHIEGNENLLNLINRKRSMISFTSYLILFAHIILILIVAVLKFGFNISFEDKISTENLSIFFATSYSFLIILSSYPLNSQNTIKRFLETRFLSYLGDISYPGYVFNMAIMTFLYYFFQMPENEFKTIIVSFILLIIISYLLHIIIENSCVRFSKNLFIENNDINSISETEIKNLNNKKYEIIEKHDKSFII